MMAVSANSTPTTAGDHGDSRIEGLLLLAVASESLGLAASTFTAAGLWLFVAGFALLMLALPVFLNREMHNGGSLIPTGVVSVVVLSSVILAIAALVPTKTDAGPEFVSGSTTFPLPKDLAQAVEKRGTESALDDLQRMAAENTDISSQAHQIAHAIGEYSLNYYPTAGEALAHCRSDFQSGCIHGVVESYLTASSGQDSFVTFCAKGQLQGSDFLRFNCLHGLGHAALSMAKYKLQEALNQCDLLGVEWDRSSCYGGVFMENVVTLYEGNDFLTTYSAEDHLYPCTALPSQYLVQCYLMQSSVILILNKYDFAAAFTECDTAPAEFMMVCQQSLGREVSGFTLRSAPESLKLCGLARAEVRDGCIVGAAKNFVDYFGRITEGIAFCGAAPSSSKAACYFAIGEEVGVLSPDLSQRSKDCGQVEASYLDACLRGARVK